MLNNIINEYIDEITKANKDFNKVALSVMTKFGTYVKIGYDKIMNNEEIVVVNSNSVAITYYRDDLWLVAPYPSSKISKVFFIFAMSQEEAEMIFKIHIFDKRTFHNNYKFINFGELLKENISTKVNESNKITDEPSNHVIEVLTKFGYRTSIDICNLKKDGKCGIKVPFSDDIVYYTKENIWCVQHFPLLSYDDVTFVLAKSKEECKKICNLFMFDKSNDFDYGSIKYSQIFQENNEKEKSYKKLNTIQVTDKDTIEKLCEQVLITGGDFDGYIIKYLSGLYYVDYNKHTAFRVII